MLLYQPQDGYCYNSDTHFLANFIKLNLSKFKNVKGELLDIGSGSGILGLLVARNFSGLNLNQSEIQEMFQFFTNKNSSINKIQNTLYKGSFFETKFDKEFDICISNPPFYHENVIKSENECLKIARYNDNFSLDDFIQSAYKALKQGGKFFFCYDVKQINEILLVLNKYKFNVESIQFVHPKKEKDATLILVYARKNSKSLTKIIPPIYVFEGSKFTQEVQNIYKESGTHSIKVNYE